MTKSWAIAKSQIPPRWQNIAILTNHYPLTDLFTAAEVVAAKHWRSPQMPTINEWITRELLVAQLTKLSEIIQLRDRRHRTEKSGKLASFSTYFLPYPIPKDPPTLKNRFSRAKRTVIERNKDILIPHSSTHMPLMHITALQYFKLIYDFLYRYILITFKLPVTFV